MNFSELLDSRIKDEEKYLERTENNIKQKNREYMSLSKEINELNVTYDAKNRYIKILKAILKYDSTPRTKWGKIETNETFPTTSEQIVKNALKGPKKNDENN